MRSSIGPLSVSLPADLRARLADEARRRGLPLSTAVRVLAAERVRQIEEAAELSAAQQWQRDQAWAAWEALERGEVFEVSADDLAADLAAAAARARRDRK